jgi:hypothetical protein
MLARVSFHIEYCAILDGQGGIVEDHPLDGSTDGRSHLGNFNDLAMSIGLGPDEGKGDGPGVHQEGPPRYALMCLEDHDLMVTRTPYGPVGVVLRKGARFSAIACTLGLGGHRPSSVRLAGWLLVMYVAVAIVPGILFFVSLFSPVLEGTIFKHPTDYLTLAVGPLTTGLGFVGLFAIPGYMRGDVGWRRTISWVLFLNFITWLVLTWRFPLGFLLLPFVLFCVIPFGFLIINQKKDAKQFFNLA